MLHILEKEVEWPTLAFFLFLFVLVGASVETGLIDSLAQARGWTIDRISSGLALSPRATLLVAALIVLWVSGILSAFINNIPYATVTIPLVATLLGRMNPGPEGEVLWWALALGACLGGNGTLIGASANVAVTDFAEKDGKRISFNEFTTFGARVTAITLILSSAYLALWLCFGGVPVNLAGTAILIRLSPSVWSRSGEHCRTMIRPKTKHEMRPADRAAGRRYRDRSRPSSRRPGRARGPVRCRCSRLRRRHRCRFRPALHREAVTRTESQTAHLRSAIGIAATAGGIPTYWTEHSITPETLTQIQQLIAALGVRRVLELGRACRLC